MIGGIRTCLGVSDDPMFRWISSNSCPLNLLLVRSYQAEIIIVKRLIQGRNNVTRVRVEPRSFDQSRRKNDAFTHSATLPTKVLKTKVLRSAKNVVFSYSAFWSAGQWGGYSPPPPPASPLATLLPAIMAYLIYHGRTVCLFERKLTGSLFTNHVLWCGSL